MEKNLFGIRKKQEGGFKMDKKYIKFYKTFHKKFKNDENLILCSKLLCDGRMILYVTVFN